MRSAARNQWRMPRGSSPGIRTSPLVHRTTTPTTCARRKRPDTTTGSRAGYSGTRRAITQSRRWSRNPSRNLAAAVAPFGHARLHRSDVLVESHLLIRGQNGADIVALLLLQIHHLGTCGFIGRSTARLDWFPQRYLLGHGHLPYRLDLFTLRVSR